MSSLTKKEMEHVAFTLERLIEWARKATETEGVQFSGLHPVDSAETVLKFLKMKAGDEI